MKAEEHDSVRLKNGLEGVIVHIFSDAPYFLLEYKPESGEPLYDQVEASFDDIEEVTWRISEHPPKMPTKEELEEQRRKFEELEKQGIKLYLV